ncbi:MAG TPA: hypothetical protein VIM30_14655, partial [Candidatus Limnocylindrales bacterium]
DLTLRRIAIAGWLLTVALTAAALAIRIVCGAPPLPNRFGLGDAATVAFGINQLTSATAGVLVLSRLPRQRVGWFLLATGLFYSVSIASATIASASVANASLGLGLARWGGWFAWLGSLGAGVALFAMVILFPDGRPSPGFGWLFRGLAIWTSAFVLVIGLQPGPMFLMTTLDNPIGIGPDVLGAIGRGNLQGAAVVGGVLAFIGALVILTRFRASTGTERLQLKWFTSAVVLAMTAFAVTLGVGFVGSVGGTEWPLAVFALASASIPIAIGIAILRYRLYAIDRIVNRTLVYAIVSAILVAVYGLSVLVLQAPLAAITGGETIAVAASTLAVAALFQSVRSRVQKFVDRRFNRSRYDTAWIVDGFGQRMRGGVAIGAVRDEIAGVVDRAVAPRTVSVWLRGTAPAMAGEIIESPISRNEFRTREA